MNTANRMLREAIDARLTGCPAPLPAARPVVAVAPLSLIDRAEAAVVRVVASLAPVAIALAFLYLSWSG